MKAPNAPCIKRICFVVCFVFAITGVTAGAQTPEAYSVQERRLATIRFSAFSGIPDILGISASLTAYRPFEIEAGVSTMIRISSAYVRAGVGRLLADKRNAEKQGWTWELLTMVGYRYLRVSSTITESAPDDFHGISGTVGIEGVYWLNPKIGLDFQLVSGALYWVKTTNSPDIPVFPDVRLAVGVVF